MHSITHSDRSKKIQNILKLGRKNHDKVLDDVFAEHCTVEIVPLIEPLVSDECVSEKALDGWREVVGGKVLRS